METIEAALKCSRTITRSPPIMTTRNADTEREIARILGLEGDDVTAASQSAEHANIARLSRVANEIQTGRTKPRSKLKGD